VTRPFFPLDQELHLTPRRRSPRLARLTIWLSAQLPYEQTRAVLAEVGGIGLSKSTCWRIMQECGEAMAQELAAEEEQVKAAAREWSTPGGRLLAKGPMGVALDGAMIHLLDEGWKEFKAACVFDVELEERVDKRTQDRGWFGHAVRSSYVVHLGGPERIGWQAWTEAQRRGWHAARDSIVIGDGASWIWNLREEHFGDSLTLVDWYHATEHLGEAKVLLNPQAEDAAASRWYNRHEKLLFQGHADQVANSLHTTANKTPQAELATELHKAAQYFAHNRDTMQYQDRRNEGWPIGSGMIESGAKQFKARVAGPGMRWRRPYAERILAVRGAVMTSKERFDDLWGRAYAA
jgi:hypothetical protein